MYELHVSVASCEIIPQNPTEEALLSFVLHLSTYLEKFRKYTSSIWGYIISEPRFESGVHTCYFKMISL